MGFLVTGKLLQDALTLFLVINPFGSIPVFLAVTRGMSRDEQLRVAGKAVVVAAAILIVFIAVGEIVLDGMNVSLPSFRVAGGLILLLVALRMVLQHESGPAFTSDAGRPGAPDVAVFPLATPFLAGPGAIMASVMLTDNDSFTAAEQAVTAGVVVAIFAVTYVILRGAMVIQGRLGTTGTAVMSRVFGLVLAALAVQTLLEGLRPYWASVLR
jgi:multiple antibiotic resistance protein